MNIEDLKKHVQFEEDVFHRQVVLSSDNAVLFVYSFLPGQAMTEHTHPFANEFITILEGEAVISSGVESVLAHQDDVILVNREEVHSIHNHSDQPLIVSSFMSPKP